jgi:Fe-S-cluster containining protein
MPVEVRTQDLVRLGILDEFHLELSIKEQTREALKYTGVSRYTASSERFTLSQKPDGSCFFLDSNKRCTQYDTRPDTCRNHPKIGPKPQFCAYMKKET